MLSRKLAISLCCSKGKISLKRIFDFVWFEVSAMRPADAWLA
jgi:hypothetical protein